MSKYDYMRSRKILESDPPFYALIMAAMVKADNKNLALLIAGWPQAWQEMCHREEPLT